MFNTTHSSSTAFNIPPAAHQKTMLPGKPAYQFFSWFVIVTLFSPLFSLGQNDNSVRDSVSTKKNQAALKNIAVEEVVVTAQYAPQSAARSVHKINIIDRKDIELSASQNLRDILRTELNIRLSQDNILGSSMSLQGVSGENVKILIDGVPVIGRQDGNLDLSQINLNNIERIEIIEGPLSVNYGTNALAGVINLITKKDQKEKLQLGLQSYYESIGQYNLSANGGIKTGKSQIQVSAGRNYFDGWVDGEAFELIQKEKPADESRYKQWKPKEQYFGELQYSYTINKNIKVNYRGAFFDEMITNLGAPRAPYKESAFDDYYHTTRIDNSVQLNGKTNNKKNYTFLAAYNDYKRVKNTYYTDLTTLDRSLSQNSGDQDTSAFNLFTSRASFNSSDEQRKLNYEVGYDISVENAVGRRIENHYQNIGDYAIFTSVQYTPVKALIIRPGLRYSYNTDYRSPLIPSINLKYALTDRVSMRASYAKGFRAPSLKELFFYFVDINHNIIGNTDLQAEKSNNYILAISYAKVNEKTAYKIESSVFFNDIYNMITLAQANSSEYTYRNVGKFQTQGIQFNNEFTIYQFKFDFGASYIGRYNELSEGTQSINSFSYYPEARVNMHYDFSRLNVTAAVFYKYSGKIPSYIIGQNNTLEQRFTEDYHTADITLTKSLLKKRLIAGVGSKNIFNVKNISSYSAGGAHSTGGGSIPVAMGRTYFLKLDFKISQ